MLTGRLCGATSARSAPSRWIEPASGCSKPAIIRSVVVLPHPDGPSSEKNSPAADLEVDAVDRHLVAERLGQPGQRHGAPSSGARRPVQPAGQVRRSSRRSGRRPPRCAAPRSATARPCPRAAGTRPGWAAPASGRGRSGRRARGSRGSSRIGSGRNETQPLAPAVTTRQGSPWRSIDVLEPGRHPVAQPVEVRVRRGGEHLGQHRPGGRHRERVAVERADLLVGAVRDQRHHLLGAADRRRGDPAADRLRQADQVGRHARQPGDAARPDGQAGLHLVEREQRAVPVQQLLAARRGSRRRGG